MCGAGFKEKIGENVEIKKTDNDPKKFADVFGIISHKWGVLDK